MAFTFQSIGASIKKKVSGAVADYKLKSEREAYYNQQKREQQEVAKANFRNELLKARGEEMNKQAKLQAKLMARQQAKGMFAPKKKAGGLMGAQNQFMGGLMGKPNNTFNPMADLGFSKPKQIQQPRIQHNPIQKPISLNINGTNVTIGQAIRKKALKNSIKKGVPNQALHDLIWKS